MTLDDEKGVEDINTPGDEQAAADLAQATDERVNRLRELATLRQTSRRTLREQLAQRRTAGLQKRHQTKLARTERTEP